jgi:hypothetical protein
MMAAGAGAIATACLFVLAAPALGKLSYLSLVVASIVIGAGECFHTAALMPLVADLAPVIGVYVARRRSSAGNRAGSARAIRRTASSICRSPSGAKDSRRQGRGSPEKA